MSARCIEDQLFQEALHRPDPLPAMIVSIWLDDEGRLQSARVPRDQPIVPERRIAEMRSAKR